jgi:rhodanese-related sulfurtransferase
MIKNLFKIIFKFSLLIIFVNIYPLSGMDLKNDQKPIFSNIPPEDAKKLVESNKQNPDFIILDVRTASEFKEGHIENAVNIDFYLPQFKDLLNKLDKNKKYLVYCRSGHRSGNAVNIMKDLKFMEVYNMTDGITKWKTLGYNLVM